MPNLAKTTSLYIEDIIIFYFIGERAAAAAIPPLTKSAFRIIPWPSISFSQNFENRLCAFLNALASVPEELMNKIMNSDKQICHVSICS